MRERGKAGQTSVEERYAQWKSLVPVLYDWFANHNLVWPSLSCRWGPQLEQATYKNRQRLYLSEQVLKKMVFLNPESSLELLSSSKCTLSFR